MNDMLLTVDSLKRLYLVSVLSDTTSNIEGVNKLCLLSFINGLFKHIIKLNVD